MLLNYMALCRHVSILIYHSMSVSEARRNNTGGMCFISVESQDCLLDCFYRWSVYKTVCVYQTEVFIKLECLLDWSVCVCQTVMVLG